MTSRHPTHEPNSDSPRSRDKHTKFSLLSSSLEIPYQEFVTEFYRRDALLWDWLKPMHVIGIECSRDDSSTWNNWRTALQGEITGGKLRCGSLGLPDHNIAWMNTERNLRSHDWLTCHSLARRNGVPSLCYSTGRRLGLSNFPQF